MANASDTLNAAKALKGGWSATEGNRGVLISALIFDALSALPWVGLIFSGLGYITIWFVLEIKGISAGLFSRGASKKIAAIVAEFGFGLVGFGIVPGITVWAFIAITESSDDGQNEAVEAAVEIRAPEYTTRVKTSQF